MVNISDDFLNDIKPIAVISICQIFVLIDAFVLYTILTKKDAGPTWPYILVVTFICGFNTYFFFFNRRWKKLYFNEFKSYNKNKSLLAGWVIFLIIIVIAASVFFSFYKMSLIDWSKYR
jgi:membrane protease YdiL (CAAX protease family)